MCILSVSCKYDVITLYSSEAWMAFLKTHASNKMNTMTSMFKNVNLQMGESICKTMPHLYNSSTPGMLMYKRGMMHESYYIRESHARLHRHKLDIIIHLEIDSNMSFHLKDLNGIVLFVSC